MARALLITCAVAVLVVAGYLAGTASGDRPYGTDDVLRAFRSAGIDLVSEPLKGSRVCRPPLSPDLTPDRFACSTVLVMSEEEPTVPLGMVPRVKLWNEHERRDWVIWLYDDEDQARHVVANPPPSRLYQGLRVARAGNIVVLYVDDTDAPRLFAALARLSED